MFRLVALLLFLLPITAQADDYDQLYRKAVTPHWEIIGSRYNPTGEAKCFLKALWVDGSQFNIAADIPTKDNPSNSNMLRFSNLQWEVPKSNYGKGAFIQVSILNLKNQVIYSNKLEIDIVNKNTIYIEDAVTPEFLAKLAVGEMLQFTSSSLIADSEVQLEQPSLLIHAWSTCQKEMALILTGILEKDAKEKKVEQGGFRLKGSRK